jgi:AcrR family transcriptional regulator
MSEIKAAPGKRGPRPSKDAKALLIEAATASLKEEGFAGTSARAVARRAGVNSALLFYYFGSLNDLLLAALDKSASKRMARYREAVNAAETPNQLATVAKDIYTEDLEGGHITLFSELIAASLSHPELGPEIMTRAEPWVQFVEETFDQVFGKGALGDLIPGKDLAYAVIAFYLGINLLTQLEDDRSRIDSLFDVAQRLAPMLSAFTTDGSDS